MLLLHYAHTLNMTSHAPMIRKLQLQYALNNSLKLFRGYIAGLITAIVCLLWLILGAQIFENIGQSSIVDLFLLVSHTVNAGWQFLFCMAHRQTFYSPHSFFQQEATAGSKPSAYVPRLVLGWVRKSVDVKQLDVRAGQSEG